MVMRSSMMLLIPFGGRVRCWNMRISDFGLDANHAARADAVCRALDLLRTTDRRRFDRLLRDVDRILLLPSSKFAGQYWAFSKTVVLSSVSVEREETLSIAMTIVHEATHARLTSAGVPFLGKEERSERCCVDEEIAFAERVPGSARLIEGAKMKLDSRYWNS